MQRLEDSVNAKLFTLLLLSYWYPNQLFLPF